MQILRQAHLISKNRRDAVGKEETAGIAFWLASALHHLGQQTRDRDKLIDAVSVMQDSIAGKKPGPKFDFRCWVAKMALDSEQIDLASQVCNQMLADNSENNQSRHTANIVLGTIAFQNGDIQLSVDHLLSAGRVGSSHRLCSYGPMMHLAQSLLESGQRQPVLQYLRDCKSFWRLGKKKLPKWIREIEAGKTPALQGDDR